MKKLLTLLLTAALATAAATTAFADTEIKPDTNGNPNPSTGTTSVTYTVQPTYTVTIPATVAFGNSTSVVTEVKAESVRIEKDKNLVITVASNNKTTEEPTSFVAKTAEGAEQTYTIKKVSTSTGSGTSGSLTSGTTGGNTGLGNMFQGVTNLTQIDLSSLNIGTLTANEIIQNSEVLKVNSETTGDKLQALLLFTVGTDSKYAGEYKDTLIFTVSVE